MTWRRLLIALAVFAGVVAWTLFNWWPAVKPHSFRSGLVLVVVGLPAWLLMEWLGEVTLRKRFDRLSGPSRITLAIPVVLLVAAIAFALALAVRAMVDAA